MFNRTIYENIHYGNLAASNEEVLLASQQAECHHFISDLKENYNTIAGDRGIKLSGGQRQRILPKIILARENRLGSVLRIAICAIIFLAGIFAMKFQNASDDLFLYKETFILICFTASSFYQKIHAQHQKNYFFTNSLGISRYYFPTVDIIFVSLIVFPFTLTYSLAAYFLFKIKLMTICAMFFLQCLLISLLYFTQTRFKNQGMFASFLLTIIFGWMVFYV